MLVAAIAYVAVPLLRSEAPVPKGQRPTPKATVVMATLILGLPIAAIALYSGISNFPWDDPTAAASAPSHGEGAAGSMDEVTQQLEARLAADPGDLEGWRMLGRTYLVNGNAAKAVTTYERVIEISGGGDPEMQLDLAEALVLTNDPASQGRALKIIDDALAADPNNGKALWYSGVIAIRADDKETAKARWTKLLEQNPPDEIRQIVVEQLAGLGVDAPAVASSAPMTAATAARAVADDAVPATGRTIRIALSVDPKVAARLTPGTPLFVSARQPGIPGPPLAAVRITSDALPTTVVLSDANSMVEGRNLSSIDDVEIVARVAFGGTAVTASGDLIGKGQQKKGGAADVAVVIDQVAP
jgi:cytochrome c-type biogenesis protein CcmH